MATIILDSLAALQAAFDNVVVGTTGGRWRAVGSGSTATNSTGPGSNNTLAFVHTETSGSEDLSVFEGRGIIDMQSDEIPDGMNRVLQLRLCIQGEYGDGTEGLEILTRADDADSWTQAEFIYGWAFSNNYSQDDTFNDENGVERTVVADGGWVDFEISIPDTAGQIEFRPHYIDPDNVEIWRHDIALRSFDFVFAAGVTERSVSFEARAGDPTASIVAQSDSIVERVASFSARAGDPTVLIAASAEAVPIDLSFIERKSLLPYTWDTPFVVAFDRATRKTREDLGLYRNLMREMVDIDEIPAQLLDNVAFRWGALAWPLEDFISNADELVMFKREVLKRTWELNRIAGQIIDGRWRAGDIISYELRQVDYSFDLGHVTQAQDGTVDNSTFHSPALTTENINAIQITIVPRTKMLISSAEQSYLRRVYGSYLPYLLYVMPIQVDISQRLDIRAYAGIDLVKDIEVFF